VPTEDEVSTAVETFNTWTEVRRTLRRRPSTEKTAAASPASDRAGSRQRSDEAVAAPDWLDGLSSVIQEYGALEPIPTGATEDTLRRIRSVIAGLRGLATRIDRKVSDYYAVRSEEGQMSMAEVDLFGPPEREAA
jgi:hypothetical protein